MFEMRTVKIITGNAIFIKPRKEIGRPRCADIDATTTFALAPMSVPVPPTGTV